MGLWYLNSAGSFTLLWIRCQIRCEGGGGFVMLVNAETEKASV